MQENPYNQTAVITVNNTVFHPEHVECGPSYVTLMVRDDQVPSEADSVVDYQRAQIETEVDKLYEDIDYSPTTRDECLAERWDQAVYELMIPVEHVAMIARSPGD